jgi:hypothetical protein
MVHAPCAIGVDCAPEEAFVTGRHGEEGYRLPERFPVSAGPVLVGRYVRCASPAQVHPNPPFLAKRSLLTRRLAALLKGLVFLPGR